MKAFTYLTVAATALATLVQGAPVEEAIHVKARQAPVAIGTATIQLIAAAATFPPFTVPVSSSNAPTHFQAAPNGSPANINYNLVKISGLPGGETCSFVGQSVNGLPVPTFTFGNSPAGAAIGPPGPLSAIFC